jgi:hypothetical protein
MKRILSLLIAGIFLLSLSFTLAFQGQELMNHEELMDSYSQLTPEEKAEIVGKYGNMTSEELSKKLNDLTNLTEEEKGKIKETLRIQSQNQEKNGTRNSLRERLRNLNETTALKNKLKVRFLSDDTLEIETENGKKIRTRLNLTEDETGEKLEIKLSNGRNAELKIMPETANEKALERLRLKVCSIENNCSIELKETGTGENTRLIYEARAEKTYKILGLFKNKEEVTTEMDAESGEEIKTTKNRWWNFLAKEI